MLKVIKSKLANNKKRNGKVFLLKLGILAFVLYMCFLLITQQIKINSRRQEEAQTNQQILNQQIKNQQMEDILNADEQKKQEYIEKRGREELNLAKEGEQVYQGVPGAD